MNILEKKQKIETSRHIANYKTSVSLNDSLKRADVTLFDYLKQRIFIYIIISLILFFVLKTLFYSVDFLSFSIVFILVYLFIIFFGGVVGLAGGSLIRKSVLKKLFKNKFPNGPSDSLFQFYEAGFIFNNDGIEEVYEYSDFYMIRIIDNCIQFNVDYHNGYVVRLSHFPNDIVDDFKNIIKKYNSSFNNSYAYKNNNFLIAIFLYLILFLFSVYAYFKSYSYFIYPALYSCFLSLVYYVIYSKYINRINLTAIISSIIFVILSIFTGYFIYYTNHFFFETNGLLSNIMFRFNVFTYMPIRDIKNFICYMIINVSFAFIWNFNSIKSLYINSKTFKNLSVTIFNSTHICKKINNWRMYIFALITAFVLIFFFNDSYSNFPLHERINLNNELYTEGPFYNDVPINKRYQDNVNALKNIDIDAYNEAIDVLDQDYNPNFCVNEYYFNTATGTINLYASCDDDDYTVYFSAYDYGTNSTCKWGEWYGNEIYQNYIDLSFDVEKVGYTVIEITDSAGSKPIYIFIDRVSEADNNIIYRDDLTTYIYY